MNKRPIVLFYSGVFPELAWLDWLRFHRSGMTSYDLLRRCKKHKRSDFVVEINTPVIKKEILASVSCLETQLYTEFPANTKYFDRLLLKVKKSGFGCMLMISVAASPSPA